MPVPISRLKKTDVAMELERLRGRATKSVASVDVPTAPAKLEKISKPVEKKVVEKKVEAPKAPKAEKSKAEKPVVEEKYVPSKFVKGSQEAKDRMAAIRAKKGKKDE